MSTRKLRVLCLHGYRQNGNKLRGRIAAYRRAFRSSVEFVCVDAPIIVPYTADEHALTSELEEVSEVRQFSWWNYHKDEITNEHEFSLVNESIDYIANIYREQGPFDGVFGFSQGGMMAALLLQLQHTKKEEFPFQFSFGIFVSSAISRDPRYQYCIQQLPFHSLHIMGHSDTVVEIERSRALAQAFDNPMVFEHTGGHYIPANKEPKDAMRAFIQRVQDSVFEMIRLQLNHELKSRCLQRARLHIGRATTEDTIEYIARGSNDMRHSILRGESPLHVTNRGVGSPYLWAKDIPRIDASKEAITSFQSNFLQTAINPYVAEPDNKQAVVESLVLHEAIEHEGIPREAIVVSALFDESLIRPAQQGIVVMPGVPTIAKRMTPMVDPVQRLSSEYIAKGLKIAKHELDVETIDHVVLRLPDELLFSPSSRNKVNDVLRSVAEVLEGHCSTGSIQTYGFALPRVHDAQQWDHLVESILSPLAERLEKFVSLQIPLSCDILPVSKSLIDWKTSNQVFLIAEKIFDATLSNGKPLCLRTHFPHLGDGLASQLQTAFNLAIAIERKYMETIRPDHNQSASLPPTDSLAWAHILANQHAQFDNLEEWNYIREMEIIPRFQSSMDQLDAYDDMKDFKFAYSMALRELLKCFTASIEHVDSYRAATIKNALQEAGLAMEDETLENIAIKAALSSDIDMVLYQDQLHTTTYSPTTLFTTTQLQDIQQLLIPLLQVGKL